MDTDKAHPPHIWVISEYHSPIIPICRYCGTFTTEALVSQPETKGAGPCPKNPAE